MIYFNFSISAPHPMIKIVICIPIGSVASRARVFVFKHNAVVVVQMGYFLGWFY